MKNLVLKRVLDAAFLITLLAATTQIVSARVHSTAPDAGSTSLLMVMACAGLAVIRRFKR
jgi:hypothetical protein